MEQRLNQMVLVQYVNWYAAQKEISIGMELNSRLGPDIRQCGTREELLEKLNRRKKNYEIRLQNLSSDLFLNQKGKVVFENCLKQDILMYTTFIEALEKQ